jgi:lipid II:glycine glycyltransferase (peptidoglycan interpeptide bridge formation enzyme)
VDSVHKDSWNDILQKFDDANLYQTWSYEAVNSGDKNLSHLLLRKREECVAAAQSRVVRIPFTNIGVAYVRWGPLWRVHGKPADRDVFGLAIRALRNEYACRRGLLVRILPFLFEDQTDIFNQILVREGFVQSSGEEAQRTLLIDLNRSLEELRKGLEQKWRNRLNRAEKNALEVLEGFGDDLFGLFIKIYEEMHGRKNFLETSDVNKFRMVQRDLPGSLKMKILIAIFDGKPAAGVICSGMGEMGTYLFGGTSDAGLSTQGSYLLQWKVLNWLKEQGVKWYNLHGINPITNPGTYRFKSGLCGRNGKDVRFLGVYDACDSRMTSTALRFASYARLMYRKGRMTLGKFVDGKPR